MAWMLLLSWSGQGRTDPDIEPGALIMKKTLIAAALALPLTAFAAVIPTTFDNTSLGGSDVITFNQLQISGGEFGRNINRFQQYRHVGYRRHVL